MLTPPETCPRCGTERNGVQENLVLFACGSIFMRDKIGFTVVEPAKCKAKFLESLPVPTRIIITEPTVSTLDAELQAAFRRGVLARTIQVRNALAVSEIPVHAFYDIIRELPEPPYTDV